MNKIFSKLSISFIALFLFSSILFAWQENGNTDLIGEINYGGVSIHDSASSDFSGAATLFVSSSSVSTYDNNGGFLPNVNNIPYAILTAPIDNFTTGFTKPTFSWTYMDSDSNPQSGFKVELSTDVNFSITNYTSGAINSTNKYWAAATIIPGNTYYWRVKVKDNPWDEWSVRVSTRKLVIVNFAPYAPTGLSQFVGTGKSTSLSYNSWTNDTSPRLQFTLGSYNSSPSLRYLIQISTKAGSFQPGYLVVNSTLPASGWLSSGTTWYDTSLTKNTSYWWRVKGIDDSGVSSAFSSGTITAGQIHFGLDKVVPARIVNLKAVTGFYPGEIKLTWTSPGDDGSLKSIASGGYRIRYSTYTKSVGNFWTNNSSNWGRFTTKYEINWTTNTSPGASQTCTLTGLISNTTYFIHIWTRDGSVPNSFVNFSGNWSPLSIGATTWANIPYYGVDVNIDTLAFGSLNVSSNVVNSQTITVTNTGNTTANYQLRTTSTTFWSIDENTPGNNTFSLQAMFNTVKPSTSTFTGSLNGLTTTYQLCGTSGGKFSGNQTGQSVPATAQRTIWYLLRTPTSTSTTLQQNINFYINSSP
jgi:hypothetical protein